MSSREVRPALLPASGTGRTETLRCGHPGCLSPTREGKPYCPMHVELMPYVAQLMNDLENQQAEHERARKPGKTSGIDPEGITAKELLLLVDQHGGRTVPRLAKDLQIEPEVVARYVAELRKLGKVHTGATRRGATTVLPVERKATRIEEEEPDDDDGAGADAAEPQAATRKARRDGEVA